MALKPKITQAVKSSVNAYLMARVYAEVQRERVDGIERGLLESAGYYTSDQHQRYEKEVVRITDPDKTWLLSEEDSQDYLLDVRFALEKAGYKIKSTPGEPEHSYCCPALTAETLQTKTEHILIDSAAEMIGQNGEFRNKLLRHGLDKYNEFINLVVKMVVNAPGFKNPLTLQKA